MNREWKKLTGNKERTIKKNEDIKCYIEWVKIDTHIKAAYIANNTGIIIGKVEKFKKKMEIIENQGQLRNIQNQRARSLQVAFLLFNYLVTMYVR